MVLEPEQFAFKLFEKLTHKDRSRIILTYASSIDGFIGRKSESGHSPLQLSGPESSVLTHWIRHLSDGILVGIGTVIADNPSLTTRLEQESIDARVIIVDPRLECPLTSKFIKRRPILLTGLDCDPARILELSKLGAVILSIPYKTTDSSKLDLAVGFEELFKLDIFTIMIEGGARIIKECLSEPTIHVDLVVVTLAPVFAGGGVGLGSDQDGGVMAGLIDPVWTQMGSDMILTGTLL